MLLKVSLIRLLKSSFIRVIIIIFICFLSCAGALFAQVGYDSRNLNENDLLIFYSESLDVDIANAWNYIAQEGLSQAAYWEYEQYNNELLDRLLNWSGSKLKEMLPTADIFEFLKTIDEANLEYLFETDDEGNIVYDDKGDPELQKADGLTGEKAAWDTLLLEKIDEIVELWEEQANVVYEELLSKFSGEVRDAAVNKLTVSFNQYKMGIEREYANIYRQAENSFLFMRLKDSFSLKIKSDEASAEVIVNDLINETQNEIDTGITRLLAGLTENNEEITVNGVSVNPDDWLESFREAFVAGLDKWDSAEEQLLTERITWDRQTAVDFFEGEQAWTEAFKLLREARRHWEDEIANIIAEGQRIWDNKREEIVQAINQAKLEIENAITERTEGVNFQIENLLDMYMQSSQMITTADNSIHFWAEEIDRVFNLGNMKAATAILTEGTFTQSTGGNNLNNIISDFLTIPQDTAVNRLNAFFTEREEIIDNWIADYNNRIEQLPLVYNQLNHWVSLFNNGSLYIEEDEIQIVDGINVNTTITISVVEKVEELYQQIIRTGMRAPTGNEKESITKYFSIDGFSVVKTINYVTDIWYAEAFNSLISNLNDRNNRLSMFETASNELMYWLDDVKRQYSADREYAEDRLSDTFGLAVGANLYEKDVLADNVWETVALDEYQVELLIAQGELNYRTKQLEIANAVNNYATDDTSARLTDAETQREYDDAYELFETAEENYETAVAALTTLGGSLEEDREALERARDDLNRTRNELSKAQELYKRKFDALILAGDNYYKDRILREYEELLEMLGLKTGSEYETVSGLRYEYLSALRKYGIESTVFGNSLELNRLISGYTEGSTAIPGIEELRENNDKINGNLVWDDNLTDIYSLLDDAGIKASHRDYNSIIDNFIKYRDNLEDSIDITEEPVHSNYVNLTAYYKLNTIAYFEKVILESNMELESRIEAVSLITSRSLSDWADTLTDFNYTDDIAEDIKEQNEGSLIEYLKVKTNFALNSLEFLVNTSDLDTFLEEQAILANSSADNLSVQEKQRLFAFIFVIECKVYSIEPIELAEKWIISLDKISDVIDEIDAQDDKSFVFNRSIIKTLTDADELAYNFFNTGFKVLVNDLNNLFIQNDLIERTRAGRRNMLVRRYAGLVRELKQAGQEHALEELSVWLFETGLSEMESIDILLKNPEALWDELSENDNANIIGVENYIIELKTGFYKIAPGLTQYVNEYLSNYINSLGNFLGFKALKDQRNLNDLEAWHEGKEEELKTELDALGFEIDGLYESIENLEDLLLPDASDISMLYKMYLALEDGFGCLSSFPDENWKDAISFSQEDVKEQLIKTAGLKLALYAKGNGTLDWEDIFNTLEFDFIEEGLKNEITAYAENIYNEYLKLKQAADIESGFDWDNNEGLIYRAALWNTFDPSDLYTSAGAVNNLYDFFISCNKTLSEYEEWELESFMSEISGINFGLIADLGAEAGVYERAVYSGAVKSLIENNPLLDKNEIIETVSWMFELYGLTMPQDTFYDDILDEDEDSIMLKCFEASLYGTNYYLSRMVIDEKDISVYVYNLECAEKLQSELNIINSYLGIIDGNAIEYAVNNSDDIFGTITGININMIEDDIFVDSNIYLSQKNSIEENKAYTYIEFFKILVSEEINYIDNRITELSSIYEITQYNLDVVSDWSNSCEADSMRPGFNFRITLLPDILALEEDSEADQLTSTTTAGIVQDTAADETYDFYYFNRIDDSRGYNNKELDIYNELLQEGTAFTESIEFYKEEVLYSENQYNIFYNLTENILNLTGTELEDKITEIIIETNYYDDELSETDSKLRGTLARIETLKAGIGAAGENLILMDLNTEEYKRDVLNPIQERIDLLAETFSGFENIYYEALGAFEDSRVDYDNAQITVRNNLDAYNENRYNLQIWEEIIEYAESVYINETYTDNQTVTPAEKLAYAQYRYEKADGIFNILNGLYGDSEQKENFLDRNGHLNDSFLQYEQQYRDYLVLEEALGILQESISEQKETVEEWEGKEWRALTGIFNLNFTENENCIDFAADNALDKSGDGFLSIEEWARSFNLPAVGENGLDILSLNLDENSQPEVNTGSNVSSYFNDEERFGADVRDFMYRLGNMTVNDSSGFNDMFSRWDKAYTRLMANIKSDGAPPYYTQEDNGGSNRFYINNNVGVHRNKLHDSFKDMLDAFNYDNKDFRISDKMIAGSSELNKVNANPEERALFNFFILSQKTQTFLNNTTAWNTYTTHRRRRFLWWRWKKSTTKRKIRLEPFSGYYYTKNKLDSEQAVLDQLLGTGTGEIDTNKISNAIVTAGFSVNRDMLNYYYNLIAGETDLTGNVEDVLSAMRRRAKEYRDNTFAEINTTLNNLRTNHISNINIFEEALLNAGTAEEYGLDDALDSLRIVSVDALKTPVFSETDTAVRFYELYDRIASEYSNNINCDSPVFNELSILMDKKNEHINSLYANRLNAYKEIQSEEWQQLLDELETREANWTENIYAVLENGREEWTDAFNKMDSERRRWVAMFEDEYEEKTEMWDAKYAVFLNGKNSWIKDAEELILNDAAKTQLDILGLDPDIEIEKAMCSLISDMSVKPDPESIVSEITGNDIFGRLLDFSRAANRSIKSIGTKLYSGLAGSSIVDSSILNRMFEFQTRNRDEVERHTGILTAASARRTIEEAILQMTENIVESNDAVDSNIEGSLTSAGFNRNGDTFTRLAVVGSSLLGGDELKTQVLYAYDFYATPEWDPGVSLEDKFLTSLSMDGINCVIDMAIRNLTEQMKDIFGEHDDDSGSVDPLIVEDLDGTFNIHVGISPELIDEPNVEDPISKNLEVEGHGELKKVYTKFFEHELAQVKGEAEKKAPFWRKSLFGGDGFLSGFSLSSLFDVAMNIVVGPAYGLIKTGIQNIKAVASGDIHFGDMLVNMGKAMGNFAVGKAFGNLNSNVVGEGSKIAGMSGFKGVLAKTAWTGTSAFAQNATQGLVNNLNLDGNGLSFDREGYRESVIGRSAIAGYVSSMAGTFVREGMGELNLKDYNGNALGTDGNNGLDLDSMRTMNSMLGNMASMGVEFGMTGKTTINLANMGNLTRFFKRFSGGDETSDTVEPENDISNYRKGLQSRLMNTGLVELHIGMNKNDNWMGFGTGGFDFSFGTLMRSMRGYRETQKLFRLRFGDDEDRNLFTIISNLSRTDNTDNHNAIRELLDNGEDSFFEYIERAASISKKRENARDDRISKERRTTEEIDISKSKQIDELLSKQNEEHTRRFLAAQNHRRNDESYIRSSNLHDKALDGTFNALLGTDEEDGQLDIALAYLNSDDATESDAEIENIETEIELYRDRLNNYKEKNDKIGGLGSFIEVTRKLAPDLQETLIVLNNEGLDPDVSLDILLNASRGNNFNKGTVGYGLSVALKYMDNNSDDIFTDKYTINEEDSDTFLDKLNKVAYNFEVDTLANMFQPDENGNPYVVKTYEHNSGNDWIDDDGTVYENHFGNINFIFSLETESGTWDDFGDPGPHIDDMANKFDSDVYEDWYGPDSEFTVNNILYNQNSGIYIDIKMISNNYITMIHSSEINYMLKYAYESGASLPASLYMGSDSELIGVSSGFHMHFTGYNTNHTPENLDRFDMIDWFQE